VTAEGHQDIKCCFARSLSMVPDQIRNLYFVISTLDQLDLDESGLTGTIPTELGQLTRLGKWKKCMTLLVSSM
jgi:hypothetical protein